MLIYALLRNVNPIINAERDIFTNLHLYNCTIHFVNKFHVKAFVNHSPNKETHLTSEKYAQA